MTKKLKRKGRLIDEQAELTGKSPTEWASVDFHTHRNEIIPLSRIESNVTCDDWIRQIISYDTIIVFVANEILTKDQDQIFFSISTSMDRDSSRLPQ